MSGADAKCQARAAVVGLSGTYKAWISGIADANSPSERFTNTANTGPYVLLDQAATVIATSWADLTDGALLAPINMTEFGEPADDPLITWTHTEPDGTPGGISDVHCQEWSSAIDNTGDDGTGEFANNGWTRFGSLTCAVSLRLYCFEQG